ncbi:MAG: STAS domain-containing protein, partial [Acidobacteriota bacterium]
MEINVRTVDDVVVVDMDGRLVAGTGDVELRDTLNKVVAGDASKILLNLSEVRRIDSAGIGELMASVKLARRFGSEVRLINVNGQVLRILQLSQLLPLLTIYDNEVEALKSFADAGGGQAA